MHEVTIEWDRQAEPGVLETVERSVAWALVALVLVLFLVNTIDQYAPSEAVSPATTTTVVGSGVSSGP